VCKCFHLCISTVGVINVKAGGNLFCSILKACMTVISIIDVDMCIRVFSYYSYICRKMDVWKFVLLCIYLF